MKKISIFFAASMMVFAAGCQKGFEENGVPSVEGDVSVEGTEEVVLTAKLPGTKTTLLPEDGYKVKWNKDDQLVVFNAPTGTTEYSGNLHFFIDEEATGRFTPGQDVTVPFEDGVNYDWYVCSPWRATNGAAELITPKGQSKDDGYFPIGAQTQTGYNNSVHIAGADIMVGKVLDTRTPEVALKHLAVLHKFTVTNNSNKPTVITKLTFNGGDNKIFGTFWIDLTADNPAIDVTKANATYNERALTIKEGEEIPVGESADFYMMTAPFTLNTGETFKVTIETSTGTQVVEKTASSDIEFAAGTYNTAELVYDYEIVYADHLYYETFESQSLSSVSKNDAILRTERWSNYDKLGMSVYDGVVANVNYVDASNSTISRYAAASAIIGMNDLYADLNNGTITVSGIKLYGYTKLNLSLSQTYKNSVLKVEYSVDEGMSWNEIATYTNPSSATCEQRSTDFNLNQSAETIWLKFTSQGRPRFDNIKLTWQE